MKRVLLVGYDPRTVDYSDRALPPGITAEKIEAGIKIALRQMVDRGWEAEACYIRPDKAAGQTVVVIGAGVRLPPKSLADFEVVINAVHRGAPTATIALNTRPDDSADAAGRWL